MEGAKAAAKSELGSGELNEAVVVAEESAKSMLAERKSLEIWEFGECLAYQIARRGVGGTKQQGTAGDAARRLLEKMGRG